MENYKRCGNPNIKCESYKNGNYTKAKLFLYLFFLKIELMDIYNNKNKSVLSKKRNMKSAQHH